MELEHSTVALLIHELEATARFARDERDAAFVDLVIKRGLWLRSGDCPPLELDLDGVINDMRAKRLHPRLSIKIQKGCQRLPQCVVLDPLQLPLHRRLHHWKIAMLLADGMAVAGQQIEHDEADAPDVYFGTPVSHDAGWLVERIDDFRCVECRTSSAGRQLGFERRESSGEAEV